MEQPSEKTCRRFLEACWAHWLGKVDNGSESPPSWILDEWLRASCVPRAAGVNENTNELIRSRFILATFFTSRPFKAPLQIRAVKLSIQKTGTENPLDKGLLLKFHIRKTSVWCCYTQSDYWELRHESYAGLGEPNVCKSMQCRST